MQSCIFNREKPKDAREVISREKWSTDLYSRNEGTEKYGSGCLGEALQADLEIAVIFLW